MPKPLVPVKMWNVEIAKRYPTITSLIIVLVGLLVGLLIGIITFRLHVSNVEREFIQRGIGLPSEAGDAGPWYLMIGTASGGVVGMAIGLFTWMKSTRNRPVISHIINRHGE